MTTNENEITVPAPLEPLLTVEDMERIFRVHRRTISRLCKRGKLPQPLKIGIGLRWRARDIEQVLEDGASI